MICNLNRYDGIREIDPAHDTLNFIDKRTISSLTVARKG